MSHTRTRPYPESTRAAVLAASLAGGSLHAIAREYGVSRRTIQNWRAQAGLQSAPVAPEKRVDLGDALYTYIQNALLALAAQALLAADPAYLAQQSGRDLAVLHGVLADKTIRVLAALESASGQPIDLAPLPGVPYEIQQ